jgi:hypothetical protein
MRTGSSVQMIRTHGSDWWNLRWYDDADDSRDIVWQKSTDTLHTAVKDRVDGGGFSILSLWLENTWDDFATREYPISRTLFYEKSQYLLALHAHRWGHSFGAYTHLENIEKIQPRNHMILLFSSSLDLTISPLMRQLAKHNDLIWIHVFHPIELSPSEDILFFSRVLNPSSYSNSFSSYKKSIETTIRNIGWSYLSMTTQDVLEQRLNYFFTHRFRHG